MSLDQDQQLRSGCHDKTTLRLDSSDSRELAKQPLQGLKLASHKVLEKAQQTGRLKCSKCGGSRMFFCYTCCSLVGVSIQEIPIKVSKRLGLVLLSAEAFLNITTTHVLGRKCVMQLKFLTRVVFCVFCDQLPVKIDIIKHPNETDGKSTAIHAKILAPSDVTMYTYPCVPEYDKNNVGCYLSYPFISEGQLHPMAGNRSLSPDDMFCLLCFYDLIIDFFFLMYVLTSLTFLHYLKTTELRINPINPSPQEILGCNLFIYFILFLHHFGFTKTTSQICQTN